MKSKMIILCLSIDTNFHLVSFWNSQVKGSAGSKFIFDCAFKCQVAEPRLALLKFAVLRSGVQVFADKESIIDTLKQFFCLHLHP